MKFFCLSLKKNILPLLLFLLAIFFVLFSNTNLIAAKNGLSLWANNVVPSLFPFFVITELLLHTNFVYYIGKFFNKIMRPLFNVPGECAFAFIIGLISGYPTGGKIVASFRKQGICSKEEGDRMLSFTNNSGPLFIISFIGISLFGDTKIGILLLITHILAGITVGIILGKLSTRNAVKPASLSTKIVNNTSKTELINFSNFGKILGKSIQDSISTLLMIGGFVVIFSVIISILNQSKLLDIFSIFLNPILHIFGFNLNFAKPILGGLIELTNGVNLVSNIPMKAISQNIIICAFLLGFGGISVAFQVSSLLIGTDLSIKKYLIGKFMQGILASFYTFLGLKFIPTLSLDLIPTSAPIAEIIASPFSFLGISNYFILLLVLFFIVFASFSFPDKKQCKKRRY